MVEGVQKKLDSWMMKTLGRETNSHQKCPIQSSCIQHVPVAMPISVTKKVDALIRNFLLGNKNGSRKHHGVNWDQVCQATMKGREIGNCKEMNISLLGKWQWRYVIGEGLWKTSISQKYGLLYESWRT